MSDLFEYQKDKIWLKEYPIKYAGTRFNARTTIISTLHLDSCSKKQEFDERYLGCGFPALD